MTIPMEKLLDARVAGQIKEFFAELKEPVQILFFGSGQSCETCEQARQLLEEVAALDERIELSLHDLESEGELALQFRVDRAPGIVIAGKNGAEIIDLGIQFSGIPSGYEFSTLVNDIVLASRRNEAGLSPETRELLLNLKKPLLLQVFVTPTWPYCPRAVLLAHQMAMVNPQMVRAEGIEATEFSELAQRYYVSGVPQTVINSGAKMVVGAVPEQYLLGEIRQALQEE